MAISGTTAGRGTYGTPRRTADPHGRTPLRRLAAAACAGALTLTLAACGADDPDPAAASGDTAGSSSSSSPSPGEGPRLVQGGEPGEAAQEVPDDTTAPENEWTHDDEMFMQMMIPHHAQALEMTALVADRSTDPRVELLAERIEAAQGPEITMMSAWLEERALDVPRADAEHGGSTHAMAGMLTPAQMDRLRAARGADFDRLFLTFMISHHEGALQMADDTAGGGLDVLVGEHRDGITSSQSAEIARMRQLLDDV